jgi:hypothetical protein
MIPVQDLTAGILAEVIRRQPHSRERTAFAWQVSVGAALARSSTVELEHGVLTVRARDLRWAREIDRARTTILTRMQQLLGASAVSRIEITEPRSDSDCA